MLKRISILALLLVTAGWIRPGGVNAQNQATTDSIIEEAQAEGDSVLVQIDSLLEVRMARLDSLTAEMNQEEAPGVDEESEFASEGERALAELNEIISFSKIILIIFFLVASYSITLFLSRLLDNLSEKMSQHRLRIKRLIPILRIVVWTLAIYVIIVGIISPPYSTIITVMASVGIAVGLASQDMLKNIFGGLMLILDRPFQVGDKVGVGEHYGEITQIGLRSSRMVTPGDSVITIPNGELIRTSVSNANSGALDCMVIAEIFMPAETNIEKIKKIAYKAAVSSRYVYLQKPISILFENEMHQRRFVIKLKVKAYVLDIRYEFPFQSDITERILTELSERNIILDELQAKLNTSETSSD